MCHDRPSVGQSVLMSKHPSGSKTRTLLLSVAGVLMWGAPHSERTLSAVCSYQRSLSRVRVPRGSNSYHNFPFETVTSLWSWPCIYIPQEHAFQYYPRPLDFFPTPAIIFMDPVEVLDTPPRGATMALLALVTGSALNHSSITVRSLVVGQTNVAELFPSNGSLLATSCRTVIRQWIYWAQCNG